MRNTRDLRGVRVRGGRSGKRRIGKVQRSVFDSTGTKFVGFIVKRPDLLFMFKRKDRFLAYDAYYIEDGRVIGTIDNDSWDEPACKRLGIVWDECVLLEGLPIHTTEGVLIGRGDAIEFHEKSGAVQALFSGEGTATKAIIGTARIPIEYLKSIDHEGECLIVESRAAESKVEGGLAAKAGEQVAIAGHAIATTTDKVGKVAGAASKKAGKAAGEAIQTGSKALGKQIGRTRGMFKAFQDEYRKESGSNGKKK